MNKQNVEDLYPLSPLQQGMLFHTLLSPDSGAYVEQITYEMEGCLRPDLYRRAWQEALDRHPVLRTAFFWEKLPKPLQVVHRRLELPVVEMDLRDAGDEVQARIDAFLEQDRAAGFDMGRPPLLRLALLRTGEAAWTGVFSFHHILLDGWSMPIVIHEVHHAYEAAVAGLRADIPRPKPFREYIGWLARQDLAQAEAFWRRALAGFTEPTLPGFAPPLDPRPGYHKSQARVPAAVGVALQGLARRHKVTLNTVVQAAWALLLSRYAGTDDVVFGATVSGRPADLDGVERMVGMFINTLPVRAKVERGTAVGEWLERLQAFGSEARQFEHAPLVEVQGWSEVPRDRPLFETLYVFENMPLKPRSDGSEAAEGEALHGTVEVVSARSPERTNYPVLLVIAPEGDELALRLTVDTARFEAAVGERMLAHLATALGELASRPGARVEEIAVVPAEERRRLEEWSRGPVDAAPETCIHTLFEAQVARTPGAVALVHEGSRVTYAELDARANRIARHLSALGVGPGRIVGVCLERTPEMIASLLGVLKAGGAYVPLDPAYPAERLEFMLADSSAAVLLTDSAQAERIPAGGAAVVRLDGDAERIASRSPDRPKFPVTPRDLAYVIFTSGSTGRPKGVMIEHRSTARVLRWLRGEHSDAELSCVLGSTSISFDVSIAEIFGTLCWGGTLLLVENALSLASLSDKDGVRLAAMVPSAAQELLRLGGIPSTVHSLDLGGEALPNPLAQRLLDLGTVRTVRNLYGPTEDTTYSTAWQVRHGDGRMYVGRPVANTRALVLDAALRPTPAGIAGELYLAGDGLARGYLARPALTAERFVPDPHGAPGSRMYRVMDRVRWSEEGALEYVERVDHQVKIRGYRVELGEIESTLAAHPGVAECVVVAHAEGDDPAELAAYWTPASVEAPSVGDLRAHLKGRLPGYMVPQHFVVLRELPRTPNGKLDRRSLPSPRGGMVEPAGGEYVPPRNDTEAALVAIWREVLGVEKVGIHDSFFDLGGHSLKATQVVSRVREALGTAIPIRAIFEAPTVAELAARYAPGADGADEDAIAHHEAEGGAPLSFAQERMWFLDRMGPGQSTYNIPFALRVSGPLDLDALERAIAEVARRHQSLRTSFREIDGRPVQVVAPADGFRLRVEDLSGLPADEREAVLDGRVHGEAVRPFDLARGPLFRALVFRLGEGDHVLSLNFHHAVSDGWSFGVFFREVTELYPAFREGRPSPLAELAVQYADYAVWQRRHLSGDTLAADVEFWRGALAGAPPLLELPTDRPRPAVETFAGATLGIAYPAEVIDRLGAVARQNGASVFQALMAAFHALMARYSGHDDVVVGTPLAGRNRPETEALIGFFVNTLPVRGDLSGDPTFRELLARTREATLGVYAHQEIPFEKLVEELKPERSLAYGPFFQVLFGLQNRGMGELRLGDLPVSQVPVGAVDSKLDLGFSLAETDDGIAGSIEYNPDLFDEETVRRMSARYLRLLDAVSADPDARVHRVPLLEPAERETVLSAWNETGAPFPDACIHELVEATVRRSPDAVALHFAGRETTYAQMDAAADGIARRLRRMGVGAESLVAVSLERSPHMIVAMLGVLKAGGAYVPVDPTYPAERREYMLADSRASVVITHSSLAADLPAHSAAVLLVDSLDSEREDDAPLPRVSPDGLAYVIYTSGTTGRPKGVMVPHRGLVNTVVAQIEGFGYRAESRVLQFASFSFDAGTAEIMCALVAGARLHMAAADGLLGEPLVRMLREERISVATLPPTVLALLPADAFPGLRSLVSTGEACNAELARRWAPGRRFVNGYGPTETTVGATLGILREGEATVHIGRPWANVRAYVLDSHLEPQAIGMPGEICVGGVGVTRGYLRRPGLTAEKFVPDPWSPVLGGRMYRTGDKGRWRADGNLEYLGRIDQQVKIRGFRIELGEVESALSALPGIAGAAVVVREDVPGDRRLAAYVVAVDGAEPAPDELRARLGETLPEFMVPATVTVLAELPLMPNGKLDRRALPAPERPEGDAAAFVEPRTETERALAAIYAELLGTGRVGAGDDFFELGGHSLLATRLVSRIRGDLDVELPVRAVFEAPTVAGLAERVDAAAGPRAARGLPLAGAAPAEHVPLSFAQERLWFLDQLEPGAATYNLPLTLRLHGALDAEAMRRSLGEIACRHEVLRAVFRDADGRPVQEFLAAEGFPLPLTDLSATPSDDVDGEIERRVLAESVAPFDLARGPLFRAALLRAAADDHVLLLNMHHAVSDGWSIGILVRELTALYGAFSAGQPSPLPELPVRYADFGVWQRAWLSGGVLDGQVEFWRRTLAGAPAQLDLPTDRPRPAVQTYRGANHDMAFPRAVTEKLATLARSEGASLFMAIMAAFQSLMGRWSGQDDVVVGTPIAGRNRAELEGLIGFFVNTLPVRGDLRGDPTFRELLRRTREATLDAYAHQDLPFEKLVAEIHPERSLSHGPVFQVMLTLQNLPEGELRLGELRIEQVLAQEVAAKYDLAFTLAETPAGLSGSVQYNPDLFDEATVARMARHLGRLMEGAAAHPDTRLSRLPLMDDAERALVVDEWNRTAREMEEEVCVHDLFARQAARTPHAPALTYRNARMTYAELDAASNRLARRLRASGVGPEVPVAISLERSPEMVVALLAVLRAGGAYLPLDPAYPHDRRAYMLADSGARIVVARAEAMDELADTHVEVVPPDAAFDASADGSALPPSADAGNLAYVTYTSGSTGRPKGVMVPHRGVVNLALAQIEAFGLRAGTRVLQFASMSFDAAASETFTTLLSGGTLVLAPRDALMAGDALLATLAGERVEAVTLPPSMLAALPAAALPRLRTLVSAGEACTAEVARKWSAFPAPPADVRGDVPADGGTTESNDEEDMAPAHGAAGAPIILPQPALTP
jgi:amino acid adenylation domain-containing protein